MMFLSCLYPDHSSRKVMQDLGNPYELHRTLLTGFPRRLEAYERVLFRLETSRTSPFFRLLVQSWELPDWRALHVSGYLMAPAQINEFDWQAEPEEIFRFRLLANPTKKVRVADKENGRRVGLLSEEDHLNWLIRKADLHGFEVKQAMSQRVNQPVGWKQCKEKTHRINNQAVQFDGFLKVRDRNAFANAWKNGIGSAKGFGFGLLSLART